MMDMNLTLRTRLNSDVRDGLPPWPRPYKQVVAITDTSSQATYPVGTEATQAITVPSTFGERLLQYWDLRFRKDSTVDSDRSCIEFAMYMAFGELGNDKEDGFKRFDTLFKSESSRQIDPSQPLRLGEVVLMGNLIELGDCWCGACCIVHACIGLGEDNPNVLEVKALGGNMSLNPLAESLTYWQDVDFPWATTNITPRVVMPIYPET